MKKICFIATLLAIIAFSACEKPANIALPNSDPKPVVFAFLSPEEQNIEVSVTLSNPIFNNKPSGSEFKVVRNALVELEDAAGKKIVLPFDFVKDNYSVPQTMMPLLPGKKYKVLVSFDNYKVYGETTILEKVVPIKNVEATQLGRDEFDNIRYSFYTRWDDLANQANYYRIILESRWSSWDGRDTLYGQVLDQLQFDGSNDGKEMFLRTELSFNPFMMDVKSYFDCYLIHADYPYFEYHKRRLNYFGEDPFGEPLPMYSNIIGGGLGVVASYRKYRTEFTVGG